MKPVIFILAVLCCPLFSFCQDITGLWKGTMYNDSTQQTLEYEIVISKVKGKYTGYSHTAYYAGNGLGNLASASDALASQGKTPMYIAKDGKIVMQDAKWLENNYPGEQSKHVIQLNVLDLAKNGEEFNMNGLFVTNRSRAYNSLTGRMSIKKVNPLVVQSDLIKYLQINNTDENLTAVK